MLARLLRVTRFTFKKVRYGETSDVKNFDVFKPVERNIDNRIMEPNLLHLYKQKIFKSRIFSEREIIVWITTLNSHRPEDSASMLEMAKFVATNINKFKAMVSIDNIIREYSRRKDIPKEYILPLATKAFDEMRKFLEISNFVENTQNLSFDKIQKQGAFPRIFLNQSELVFIDSYHIAYLVSNLGNLGVLKQVMQPHNESTLIVFRHIIVPLHLLVLIDTFLDHKPDSPCLDQFIGALKDQLVYCGNKELQKAESISKKDARVGELRELIKKMLLKRTNIDEL